MPIIARGQQRTLADLKEGAASADQPQHEMAAGALGMPQPAKPESERIGVVFVHGIGAQQPGETLLDWSRPIIKIVTEWRQRHKHPPDPVVASRIDFSGTQPPVIQLEIPALSPDDEGPGDYPAQTWFLTEAWWASSVRPPSLGTMTRWLVQDLGRVVSAVQQASNERRSEADPGPAWVQVVDRLQSIAVPTIVGLLWSAGAALALPYSIVRSLPLIGDKIAIAQLDTFLVNWFGDLRVLLHDQAQAANIRGRVAETLSILRDDYACTSILLVAHSGGVVVSLTTLSDPFFASSSGRGAYPVTKLLTIGQGMGIAWNLWNAWKVRLPSGDRLLGSPYDLYPNLRWIDFWGTYDPAPAGKFRAPDFRAPDPQEPPGRPASEVTPDPPAFGPAESRAVWNRMSFREDHGAYWDNEEQFVIDLVREIDTAGDAPERPNHTSRFFRDPRDQALRVSRRIERVAILGWWRWVVAFAALVALVGASIHASSGGANRLADIGAFAAKEYAKLPGHEIGSGPLDSVANIAKQIGDVPVIGPSLALFGQAAIVLAVLLVVFAVPGWYGWWRRLSRRVDGEGRFANWLRRVHWPGWLPPRIAVAVALYVAGVAIVTVGSRTSIDWVVNARSWLADRVHDVWTAQTGNVLFGVIVVVLAFVAIEVWGASRWEGWDQRERWEARTRPLPPADRGRVKIQAAGFLLLLAVAVVVIAFVDVP